MIDSIYHGVLSIIFVFSGFELADFLRRASCDLVGLAVVELFRRALGHWPGGRASLGLDVIFY